MMKDPASLIVSSNAAPLGLYVHLPWCARKCPYCDFNSFELRGALPETEYVEALLRDLEHESQPIGHREVASIYMGGGTPSLFSAQAIQRLLEGIGSTVAVAGNVEVTLEANPGATEAGKFGEFRDAGVNRISIGVQSLRDEQLERLGRVHSAAQARSAVAAALAAGFDSVNLDLMYGLPRDSAAEGLADLEAAIALGTPHLSWYQLTLEPNTAWERRPPAGIPTEDSVERLEQAGREMLASAGFERYEISAYAKDGHQCRHNLLYWRFGDYVGIGAGAGSKMRMADGRGHRRYSKLRNPRSYLDAAGGASCVESSETITEPQTVSLEYLMNALRLVSGTTASEFEAATGIGVAAIERTLSEARELGLLENDTRRLCATREGMNQLNSVLRMFC